MDIDKAMASLLVWAVVVCAVCEPGVARAEPLYLEVCGGGGALYGAGAEAAMYLVGDLNGDGHVDVEDVLTMAETWGKDVGAPGFNGEADLNCDGTIGVDDLTILAASWGV